MNTGPRLRGQRVRDELAMLLELRLSGRRAGRTTAIMDAAKKHGFGVLVVDTTSKYELRKRFPDVLMMTLNQPSLRQVNRAVERGFLLDHAVHEQVSNDAWVVINELVEENKNLARRLEENGISIQEER